MAENEKFKKMIGSIMLISLFGGIFLFGWKLIGFISMLQVIGITVSLVVFITVTVFLLVSDPMEDTQITLKFTQDELDTLLLTLSILKESDQVHSSQLNDIEEKLKSTPN